MAHHCKDCDRLQSKQIGSAPERPVFQQPTMYDHFGSFQKFQQTKEEESRFKQRQEEHSKFNANFTDFTLNCGMSQENFQQTIIQDATKFCQHLSKAYDEDHRCLNAEDNNLGSCVATVNNCKDSKTTEDVGCSDMLTLQKKKSLLSITRTPVQCPISDCNHTMGVTSVLSHYLHDHSEEFGVQCQEIFMGKSSLLIFDPNTLDFGENVCLGVLAYGGNADDGSTRPAERGICIHNTFLPKPYENLDAHLPILILACRTSWIAMLANKELENRLTHSNNEMQELLVIWLASEQTTKPIHCTLSVYDKLMTSSRSTIIRVRHLNDSQDPREFTLKDTNCMRLSHGEIKILSQDRKECIQMEIIVNEYE